MCCIRLSHFHDTGIIYAYGGGEACRCEQAERELCGAYLYSTKLNDERASLRENQIQKTKTRKNNASRTRSVLTQCRQQAAIWRATIHRSVRFIGFRHTARPIFHGGCIILCVYEQRHARPASRSQGNLSVPTKQLRVRGQKTPTLFTCTRRVRGSNATNAAIFSQLALVCMHAAPLQALVQDMASYRLEEWRP